MLIKRISEFCSFRNVVATCEKVIPTGTWSEFVSGWVFRSGHARDRAAI